MIMVIAVCRISSLYPSRIIPIVCIALYKGSINRNRKFKIREIGHATLMNNDQFHELFCKNSPTILIISPSIDRILISYVIFFEAE